MKKQHYYFLLSILFLLLITAGCGSGGSDSGKSPDNNTDTATDGNTDGNTDNTPTEELEGEGLVFTEIMYHPADDEPEFLELVNNSGQTLDISGYYFSEGIDYTFESGTVLAPGEIIVLSDVGSDMDGSLAAMLPENVRLFAPYNGHLDDGGEEIELRDAEGKKVCDITYDDEAPWPVAADGFGYSMVVADPTPTMWSDAGQAWRTSADIGGFPGTLDATEVLPDTGVRVNEVLTHTDTPGGDAIELYNDSASPVDISGWYLTDDKPDSISTLLQDDYAKFQIPEGTVIEPNGYLVLYEIYDPGNSQNLERFVFGADFQLNAHGEDLFLFAMDNGAFSGYAHGFSFGEVENNISFGKYVNASGQIQFIAQRGTTFGSENAGPYVGDIVISEIMYHADGTIAPCNFVEITNTGNNETILFDYNNPENTWEISGIDFAFSGTVTIRSEERIVLIEAGATSVADFRSHYNLGDGVQIYEYEGELKGSRQTLEVLKPEDPLDDDTVPHMTVDRAGYDEDYPGLEEADGNGVSVVRSRVRDYGDDYTNWELSIPGGTPGY